MVQELKDEDQVSGGTYEKRGERAEGTKTTYSFVRTSKDSSKWNEQNSIVNSMPEHLRDAVGESEGFDRIFYHKKGEKPHDIPDTIDIVHDSATGALDFKW